MKKILITGGTGYLGKNLIQGLLHRDYKVVALVRATSNIDFLTNLSNKISIVRLGDYELDALFFEQKFDIIIHTAANYGRKGESLTEVVNANLSLPVQILDLAIKHGVKSFINTDTSLPKELNAYSRSKKQFLEWLESNAAQLQVVNLQLEYFYGPHDAPSKFITFVLKELKSGKTTIDFTAATPYRDFIYIDDVVSAYLTVLDNLTEKKGIVRIEVGSGKAEMLKDIIEQIQTLSTIKNVKLNFGALPMRPNEIMHSCANTQELQQMGWRPKYTFREGILKMINIENNAI